MRLGRRLRHIWPPALVLIVLAVAWEVITTALSVSSSVLPGPALVLEATWEDRSNLWPAMWTTTKEAALGILVASIVALLLALAIDWSRTIRRSLYPLMVTSPRLPIIVLAPLCLS